MRTAILGAVMVVSVAALTSCTSETTSGQPQPGSSTAGSSAPTSVDVAALDSGDYSTEPRRLAPPATSINDVLLVESQRLAEFTTLPAEMDPTLTAGNSAATFFAKQDFKEFFRADDRPAEALTKNPENGFLAGFRGFGSDPNSQFPEDSTNLWHGVMRFETPEKAAAAARVLSESRTAPQKIELETPFRSISVPTLPGTLVTTGTVPNPNGDKSKDTIFLSAITAHGAYVILDEYSFIPVVRDAAIAALSRGLALQKTLIDKFPRTRGRGDETPSIVVDQNKILLYTLPNPGTADKLNDSVLGPRGIAFTNADPVGTMQLLTEVGSLHNAVAGSRVFRADTAAGAQKIAAHQTAASTASSTPSEVKPAASPPGLPQATCILIRRQPLCDVTVGRYVGEVSGDDLTDVHRQTVAQYKVLLKADQKAN